LLQDPTFKAMVAEIGASPDLYKPSRFWDDLNPVNTGWLNEFGLENFKRTVSQNYFNWLIVSHRDVQFRAAAREWLRRPTLRPLLTRMESPELLRTVIGLENAFGKRAQLTYCLFVAMLWDVTSRHDPLGLTKKLEEPTLGTPLGIVSAGRRISQDLANSIREYNAIARWSAGRAGKRTAIAELGAGYGRLAHVALTNPNNRYFVFDIPPALFVSQWYLSRLFPDRKVFSFRHFESFESVAAELEASDIVFATPNQMALFPERYFDVFASISTLPEMSLAQISNYLTLIARLTARTVYLKQWRQWTNEKDKFDFSYDHLVLPPEWNLRRDATDIIQPLFQERIWTRSAPAA
jgi:putative sugar O-methyltransferase